MQKYKFDSFMGCKPTRIAIVEGVHLYEHPISGDEIGLVAVLNGECWQTDSYEPEDAAAEALAHVAGLRVATRGTSLS